MLHHKMRPGHIFFSFLWNVLRVSLSVPDWTLGGMYERSSMLFCQGSVKLKYWAVAQRDSAWTFFFFFNLCAHCSVSAVHFIRNVPEQAIIWGNELFLCSIRSTVNTWTFFLLIREKNILVIVNSHAHAQALATSNGKLLWGLADCHHFDSLSSISPEQQWSSYAESIICSQPIYRETAITFYHGWEPSSCFLLNLPFQIPVSD